MTTPPFIAVDWGTTNRRAWRIEGGRAVAHHADDRGVRSVDRAGYRAEMASLRARLGALPVLAAGMVGSTRGWQVAPYVACPVGPEEIAAALLDVGDDIRIVPGVAQHDDRRPDVMRGEELQFLGAIAAGLAAPDATMVQPGTHSKWAWSAGGRIVRIATAMTGELFQLLRERSVLAEMMDAPVDARAPGFADGVARGAAGGGLTEALFGVRAGVLLGTRPEKEAAAYASGLLIGAELGARSLADAGEICLIADGTLADLYEQALTQLAGNVRRIDSGVAFVAGARLVMGLGR